MTNVELPQLGESVEEGVITNWLVEIGDNVDIDQPIAEISTDKVDTEIPSPVTGTVTGLRVEVDDTVRVGQVIAVIQPSPDSGSGDSVRARDPGPVTRQEPQAEPGPMTIGRTEPPSGASDDEARPASGDRLTSPLVRQMLRQVGQDPADVTATGPGGRVTRADAEHAIATVNGNDGARKSDSTGKAHQPGRTEGGPSVDQPQRVSVVPARSDARRPGHSPDQVDFGGQPHLTQELSRVRRAIANGMWESLQSTAQLTAVVEVDMTAIMTVRASVRETFESQHGTSLSPLPFIARAVTMTIPRHPAVNSSIDLDTGTVTYHRSVHLGMAVDTERGLLVPNIKNAEGLTVTGLATAIADIAKRTRDKSISPSDVTGATFTISNTGSRGTLFDTPILNPPEVAILAVCAVEKRPIVVSDAFGDSIAIRWMSYLCLTYDHRMLDGADAARFLQDLKWAIEHYNYLDDLV